MHVKKIDFPHSILDASNVIVFTLYIGCPTKKKNKKTKKNRKFGTNLNVMDFSMWGLLFHQLHLQTREVTDEQFLKTVLVEAWSNIPYEVIQKVTGSWLDSMLLCSCPRKTF